METISQVWPVWPPHSTSRVDVADLCHHRNPACLSAAALAITVARRYRLGFPVRDGSLDRSIELYRNHAFALFHTRCRQTKSLLDQKAAFTPSASHCSNR